jgi:hypothetical protein
VNRGEFAIDGLRNRDLQALRCSTAPKTKAGNAAVPPL